MLRKLQVAAVLMCMSSYVVAGTVSIGTVSARGDMRVDSHSVKGNATLFDGSVVETGQATADLRLSKGVEVMLSTSSRGTLYRDRLVLQQGETELTANSSFQLEANGFRVTPSEPNSRGVVSIKAGNRVQVAALNGSFGVTNDHGVLLASVRPGRMVSFAMQAAGKPSPSTMVGMVTDEGGHYYLTDSRDVKYEITGKDLKKYVGMKVQVSGTVVASAQPGTATAGVVSLSSIDVYSAALAAGGAAGAGALGMSTSTLIIIGGAAVAAVGVGVGLAVVNQGSTPASR